MDQNDWLNLPRSASAALSSPVMFHVGIPILIGIGTVVFAILVNHAVRLHRIKLIYGFAMMFSPRIRSSFATKAGGPNMTRPSNVFVGVDAYTQWAVDQALKPSTYRVRIPKTPNPIGPGPCYRVFTTKLPDGATSVGEFTVVGAATPEDNGQSTSSVETYEVYEFTDGKDATIKHMVRLIMDDLHVMRLRQIWESIGRILGSDAASLDDSEDAFLGA